MNDHAGVVGAMLLTLGGLLLGHLVIEVNCPRPSRRRLAFFALAQIVLFLMMLVGLAAGFWG